MSEKDLMDYLKKEEYYKEKNDIEISGPLVQPEYPEISSVKTQVMILPLSLEDEVQTCGTANVLKEFAKNLNIKCSKNTEYIVFNEKNNKFDIKAARERYIFYKEMEQHQNDMISLKHQFVSHRSFPKHDDNHSGSDDLEDNLIGVQSEKLASSFKTKMKQISSHMSKLLKKMKLLVQDKNISDAYSAVKLHISEWIGQIAESIKDESIYNCIIEHIQEKNTITASVFELLDEHVDTAEQLSEHANTSSNAEDTTAAKRPLRDHVITVGDVKTTMTIRGASAKQIESNTEIVRRHFNHGNFQRNFNAIEDFFWGVMVACVKEFQSSTFFPPSYIIEDYKKKDQEYSKFVLKCFKDWLDYNKTDSTFEYFYLFLTKFGPLLYKLRQAVRMGNGKAREACWIELTPIFAAFNKKNYKTESLVHMLNFTALWPLAYREMFRRNCSVNVKGKHGHNFAIDEYMETFVVKPVKLYGRKQTTIEMLGKICMNIELLEHIKSIYQQSFDTSIGGKSSVPDPTPDWIKVAWFAIHHKWLINAQRKTVNLYPHGKKELSDLADIPKECLNVEERGCNKIKENFSEMIYRQFPTQTFVNFTKSTDGSSG
ncbi:Hypothetical predicted protein [Paramuricea clavata]|uniref:DUF6589 domain-containing protein n=1 Tax=Paramuricea clavata TaxID=317549 RepID=A0A7D9E766_PARCT|nr:Hypothetical predicted protein [Paramuricea clavata]